jgi:ubiquinone/menaquinone biosynthesis C-methylase UbiE
MSGAEFDKFARNYADLHQQSIAFSGCDTSYFSTYKAVYAAQCYRQYCPQGRALLDFGCGTGALVPEFRKLLPLVKLYCADVSQESLDVARELRGLEADYLHISSNTLDLPSSTVDMAVAACVFHHISASQHAAWLAELRRVVRPGGTLLIFEHNPVNPLTRYAVASCAFDEDAVLIRCGRLRKALADSSWAVATCKYHVFFPEVLRSLRVLEQFFGWLPLGGQYSVLALKQ